MVCPARPETDPISTGSIRHPANQHVREAPLPNRDRTHPRDAWYSCPDGRCPSGFVCVAGVCRTENGADASARTDAGSVGRDAETDGEVAFDAGSEDSGAGRDAGGAGLDGGVCERADDCSIVAPCREVDCIDGRCQARILESESCQPADVCVVNGTCNARGECVGDSRDCSGLDSDCGRGACDSTAGRVEDACVFQPRSGSSCELVGGEPGVCDDGSCEVCGVVGGRCCSGARCLSEVRPGRGHNSWCGAGGTCVPANVVFVTSTRVSSSMGGLLGADAICRARAMEGGLSGNYVAWLSSSSISAGDRLAGARGWVRPDGEVFADRLEDLLDDGFRGPESGRVTHPAVIDEGGRRVEGAVLDVWTGTLERNCGNWTASGAALSDIGSSQASYVAWRLDQPRGDCSGERRLYCFGTDHTTAVRQPRVEGRLAFLTLGRFAPTGGLVAADALCDSEAALFGVAGTFRAALADVGTTIASRFDLDGPPWVRADGAPIARTARELFSEPFFAAPPDQTLAGSPHGATVWLGIGVPGDLTSLGTLASTCAGWTSEAATGASGRVNRAWVHDAAGAVAPEGGPIHGIVSCAAPNHLLCLQE